MVWQSCCTYVLVFANKLLQEKNYWLTFMKKIIRNYKFHFNVNQCILFSQILLSMFRFPTRSSLKQNTLGYDYSHFFTISSNGGWSPGNFSVYIYNIFPSVEITNTPPSCFPSPFHLIETLNLYTYLVQLYS